jgi:hypothetical protein
MNLAIPNQNITVRDNATNAELQKAIEAAIPAAIEQTKGIAPRFKGRTNKQTARNIFDFLKNNINYKVDGENQKVQLPSALLRNRQADCKSYSLFTAAILSNLSIPYELTYASYTPGNKDPEHIYVTLADGTIIDAVWGKFNSEKKPIYKYRKPMKISYISGVKPGIGRTYEDWAKAVGVWDNYTTAGKAAIRVQNLTPLVFGAREVIEQLIRKNGGGIADFLNSISPLNTTGKINSTLKSQWNEAFKKGVETINRNFYVDPKWLEQFKSKATTSTSSGPLGPVDATGGYQTTPADQKNLENLNKRNKATDLLIAELNKMYPYVVYPASTPEQAKDYRKLEIKWLELGGNPDVLNNAVKEGITKSPRGKDFNYLMGKIANKDFDLKDVGLAVRAILAVTTGGERFGLQNPGIWTPWSGMRPNTINGTFIGAEPATTATTTAAAAPWWAPYLTTIVLGVITAIPKGRQDVPGWDPTAINNLPDTNDTFSALPSWLLPAGLAAGAYFLLKDEL